MKRMVISDLRRTLSVVMAVILLLSAWAFVVPEHASAVSAGTYYVKVYWNVGDDSDKTNWWYLDYKDQTGTQQTGSTSSTGEGTAASSGGDHSKVITMNGVPNKIHYQLQNAGGSKFGSAEWYITKITIGTDSNMTGEKTLWQGSVGCKCENVLSKTIGCTYNIETNTPGNWSSGDGSNKKQETSFLNNPFLPTLTGATYDTANNDPADFQIPSDPNGSNEYTNYTTYATHAVDQYGVRLCTAYFGNNYKPTATVSFGDGVDYDGRRESETSGHGDYTISVSNSNSGYDVTTYRANRRMEKADTLTPALTVSYTKGSITKSVTSDTFIVYDPKYEHTLNANSGAIFDADGNNISGLKFEQYYYAAVSGGKWTSGNDVGGMVKLPDHGERLGYTYKGMYTGSAQTSTDWTKWEKVNGQWTSTWTPDGTKLATTTRSEATTTWRAAWHANPCVVTMYDYRGAPTSWVLSYNTRLQDVAEIINAWENHPSYKTNTYTNVFEKWLIEEENVYQLDGTQTLNTDSMYTTANISHQVKGDITIRAHYIIQDDTYNPYHVTFMGTNGTAARAYEDYRYNAPVISAADGHSAPVLSIAADMTYTYTFAGWTPIAPSAGSYYLFDSPAEAQGACEEFAPVTCDITYYPVFFRTYIPYTVNFKYVPDGKAASDEDASTDYENHSATYHWDQDIIIPNMHNELGNQYSYTYGGGRYSFTVWDSTPVAKCAGDATYTAVYGDYEPAKYTVSFVDTKGAYGTADEPYIFAIQENIVHGANADEITVPAPDPVDIDGYRYTFNGWTLNGAAATPVLTGITADAIYSATWRRTVLCDVEFYNGSEHIADADLHDKTEGEPIAYVGAAPYKAPDDIADNYEWIGWLDAEGNEVTAIPGGTTLVKLYANYEIRYHNYTVTFKNDIGETILEKTDYHYGDDVVEPTEAQRAKAADATYNYTFTRWDKPVTDVEEDAVYTAVYLSHYNYYEVKWLNNDGSTVYSSSSYIYNERISAPFMDDEHKPIEQNPPQTPPPPGYTRDFTGWKHYEGGTVGAPYSRSDRCGTSGATYIATFGNVADLKTVTLYDRDGTTKLGEIKVEYNSKLSNDAVQSKLPTPKMYRTEDQHFYFDKYVNLDGSVYNYDAAITTNLSLKASYAGEGHTFKPKSVTTAPTFEEGGTAVERCEDCGYERNTTVPMLEDTMAPTATLFIRDVSWNGSEATGTLNGGVTQTATANLVAITTKDTAEIEPNYNPNGEGSKVRSIDVVIAKEETVREISAVDADEWFNVYTRAANDAGNANHTNVMKNVVEAYNATHTEDKIEHGDKFVIYVKVADLNQTTYVRSGVLQLDTYAPDLIMGDEGEFFNADRNIFCLKATAIVDTDATSYTLTVGGEIKTTTDDKYVIDQPGYYSVTVKDVAGNSITKNIEVKASHTDDSITIAPSCEVEGSTYEKCAICARTTEPRTVAALGHDEVATVVDPTCEADGYTRHWCRRCNQTISANTDIIPAYGHVYPNDSELYGENAGQSAWTENTALHRNPTCIAEGTSYWVCNLCGKQETRTIEVDPGAHSFYRGVTTKPECTTDGYITYTCKLCGHVKTITPEDGVEGEYDYLKATGHTPGDWAVATPASCSAAGTKEQTCTVCGEVLDTAEIPALEPQWVAVVTPPGDGTAGYTTYTCAGCGGAVAGHETYTGDYVDPLTRVTITFVDEDGTTELTSVRKLQGESVAESEVNVLPTKASDNTYNYTFASWLDGEGQPVSFPITVGTENATYKASYSSRYINYTLILKRSNGEVFKKLGYQHNDDSTIDLAVGPNKDSNETTDFAFDGWYYQYNLNGTMTDSDTFTSAKLSDLIAAGIFNDDHEATLYPHYAETAREYTVVFGYDPANILASVVVNYGDTAYYPGSAPTPEKAFDELGHYTWTGWSADLTNVVQNLFVKPVFEKAAHDFSDVVIIEHEGAAQCTEPEQKKFTCTTCGYSYTQTTAAAPGHDWGTGVDGVQTCTRCGETRADQTLYTITFMVDGTKYKSYSIKYGETFSKPADPTKASDGQFTYAFAYWYTTDDETAVEVNTTCSGNITYYAKFNATERLFSVAFGYDANNIIETHSNVPYGTGVTYGGTTPVKASDATYHYTFTGWNKDTSSVTENMNVYANFSKDSHSFDSGVEQSAATCQHGKIMKYTCPTCGYSYTKETGSKLNHNWVEKSRVNPTATQDGKIIYECSICHNQKEETLSRIFLKVTVKDQNGNPVSGVTVKVYDGNTFIGSDVSNGSGVATIVVPEAKTYRIEIEGRSANVTVNQNGNITGGSVPTVERNSGGNTSHGCDCTCHKSGLWPTIFRFFHKIIKLITGEFRCCPDAHY